LGYLGYLFKRHADFNNLTLSNISLRGRFLRRTYIRRSERFKFFARRVSYTNLASSCIFNKGLVDFNAKFAGALRPMLRALA
jgi:hypothetical protein